MLSTNTKVAYKNKYKEKNLSLNQKMLFTALILIVIQFLSQVPLLGINRDLIGFWLESDLNSAFGMFNIFSGMSFENLSIFALGIAPYITASIVIQLLRVAISPLDAKCKEAKDERSYVEKLTYVTAAILGIIQVIPLVMNISSSGLLVENTLGYKLGVGASIFVGSAIMIAFGKLIDKKGIGNGISLILMANILTSLKGDLLGIYSTFISGKNIGTAIAAIVITVAVIIFSLIVVIFLHEGKKDIKVMFSGRMQGGKMVKPADNIIPLKVNMSGVMPVIFASTFLSIIPMITALVGAGTDSIWYEISKYFNQGYWFNFSDIKYTVGVVLYFGAIVFFSYFYNTISFSTKDLADSLNRQGGTIAGIRPGKSTQEYLDGQIKYMLLLGSLILIVVAVVPMIIGGLANVSLSFGGTSIIIIVSVMLETYKTIKTEQTKSSVVPKKYSFF